MATNFLTVTDRDKPLTATGVKNRMIAKLLEEGSSNDPIASHWQGANRIAQSLLGGYQLREADKEEKAGQAAQNQALVALLSGNPTPSTAPGAMPSAPPATPRPMPSPMASPAQNVSSPVPPDDPTMSIPPRQVQMANGPQPNLGPVTSGPRPPLGMHQPTPSPMPPAPSGPMQGASPATSSAAPPQMQAQIQEMLNNPNPAIQQMGRQLAAKILAERMQGPEFQRLNDDALYDKRTGRIQPIQGDFYRPITDPAERSRYNIPPEDKRPYQLGPGGKLIPPPAETRVNMSTVADPILTGVGEQITKARAAAREVPQQIQSIHEARRSLDEGMISGAVADWRLAASKLFGLAPDQVANTEVFRSSVGDQVLSSIKALGANPSNTDRDYIEKVKGGQITLDETSLRRILDIQEKYARQTLRTFNREAKTIMDTNPDAYRSIQGVMQFEEPGEYTPPQRPAPNSGTSGGWQTQTLPNGRTIRIRPKQ